MDNNMYENYVSDPELQKYYRDLEVNNAHFKNKDMALENYREEGKDLIKKVEIPEYIARAGYNSLSDVDQKLAELNKEYNDCSNELLMIEERQSEISKKVGKFDSNLINNSETLKMEAEFYSLVKEEDLKYNKLVRLAEEIKDNEEARIRWSAANKERFHSTIKARNKLIRQLEEYQKELKLLNQKIYNTPGMVSTIDQMRIKDLEESIIPDLEDRINNFHKDLIKNKSNSQSKIETLSSEKMSSIVRKKIELKKQLADAEKELKMLNDIKMNLPSGLSFVQTMRLKALEESIIPDLKSMLNMSPDKFLDYLDNIENNKLEVQNIDAEVEDKQSEDFNEEELKDNQLLLNPAENEETKLFDSVSEKEEDKQFEDFNEEEQKDDPLFSNLAENEETKLFDSVSEKEEDKQFEDLDKEELEDNPLFSNPVENEEEKSKKSKWKKIAAYASGTALGIASGIISLEAFPQAMTIAAATSIIGGIATTFKLKHHKNSEEIPGELKGIKLASKKVVNYFREEENIKNLRKFFTSLGITAAISHGIGEAFSKFSSNAAPTDELITPTESNQALQQPQEVIDTPIPGTELSNSILNTENSTYFGDYDLDGIKYAYKSAEDALYGTNPVLANNNVISNSNSIIKEIMNPLTGKKVAYDPSKSVEEISNIIGGSPNDWTGNIVHQSSNVPQTWVNITEIFKSISGKKTL